MESGSDVPPVRQCRAKLADLADALDMVNQEVAAYVDLETGEILYVSDDARRELEAVYESLPDDVSELSVEEQRWYAFKQERLRDRIREWLADERIELVEG